MSKEIDRRAMVRQFFEIVVEGFRIAFGVDGDPIWAAVHAANMAKRGGPCVGQKLMKPEGWKPADVEALIRAQG